MVTDIILKQNQEIDNTSLCQPCVEALYLSNREVLIKSFALEREIDRFLEFGIQLKCEGWEFEDIYNMLIPFLKSKFGFK